MKFTVWRAVRGPKAGDLAVIRTGVQRGAQVQYLAVTMCDSTAYPGVMLVTSHETEFEGFYSLDKDFPLKEIGKLYKQYALTLGARADAIEVLRQIIELSEEDITMATKRAAAADDASESTKVKAPKTTAAKKAPVAAEKKPEAATTKAAPAKEPKATAPKATTKAAAEKPTKAQPAAKVAAPKADGEKVKRPSASALFQELIMAGKLTDDQIFAEVQKQFGLDDSKRSYVAWNRNFLAKNGKNPPAPVGGEAPKAARGKKAA